MERRYLIVPGLRSSRIHVLDTKADPLNPTIVKVVEPGTVASLLVTVGLILSLQNIPKVL